MTKSRAGGASGRGAGGWLGTERGQSGGRWLLGLGTDQSGGTVSRAWRGSSGRPEAENKVATKTRVLDWGGGGRTLFSLPSSYFRQSVSKDDEQFYQY